jgi:hypothetical protein
VRSIFALDSGCSRYPSDLAKGAEVRRKKNGSILMAYEIRTKSAESGGLETNGPRERIWGVDGLIAVRRFLCEDPRLLRICTGTNACGEC